MRIHQGGSRRHDPAPDGARLAGRAEPRQGPGSRKQKNPADLAGSAGFISGSVARQGEGADMLAPEPSPVREDQSSLERR